MMANTKTKILLSASTLALLAGCSVTEIPERKAPQETPPTVTVEETAPPMETETPSPLATAAPDEETVQPAGGDASDQTEEYLDRAEKDAEALKEKAESLKEKFEDAKEENDEDEESPSPEAMGYSSWFGGIALADEAEETPESTPEESGDTHDEEELETTLKKIELHISLALESLEYETDPEVAQALLQKIEESEVYISGILESIETNAEQAEKIQETRDALEIAQDTIQSALLRIDTAIENDESTVDLEIETTIDALTKNSDGSYSVQFTREEVAKKQEERIAAHLKKIKEKLLAKGVDPKTVDAFVGEAEKALADAQVQNAGKGALIELLHEYKALQYIEENNIDPAEWKTKKAQWKQEITITPQSKKAEAKALYQKLQSGSITREELGEEYAKKRKEAFEEQTQKIYKKIQTENPEAAEKFIVNRTAILEKIEENMEIRKEMRAKQKSSSGVTNIQWGGGDTKRDDDEEDNDETNPLHNVSDEDPLPGERGIPKRETPPAAMRNGERDGEMERGERRNERGEKPQAFEDKKHPRAMDLKAQKEES